jgi:hypothetical protein
MEEYGIEYIPCTATVEGGVDAIFDKLLGGNNYLLDDDKDVGEGIVIKRYDFINKFGKTVWAKRVTSDFKYNHCKTMGAPSFKGGACIEEVIVHQYVTPALVDKVHARFATCSGGWESKYIPALLGCVYYALITEELWSALKKYKNNHTINFQTLNKLCVARVKQLKPELF